MSSPPAPRPIRVLLRDLGIAIVLAAVLLALFTVPNAGLRRFTGPEVLLLEGGAVVLVAYLVARAISNATTTFLRRHGLAPRGHAIRLFLNLLVGAGAVLALFRLAGVSVESIFVGAGFAGIVLGLAAQTVLSNAFAGILLIFADPFRPGDRVSFITWQYGLIGPSYPHESIVPTYSGTVEDVGLTYTIIALDTGGTAKVPNAITIQAIVLEAGGSAVHRVRMTFPFTVAVSTVEAAVSAVAGDFPAPFPGAPPPRVEATDISATSWDAVVVLWSRIREPGAVRDKVIRAVLARMPAPPPAPSR